MKSIFRVQSIDREEVHWEDHLKDLTPFEEHAGVWWKREDYFAPLGYGGINGSKLRQCIWLIERAARAGARGVLSGSSVKSPQISMGTAVARHFGLESIHVLGATKPTTAMKHENVDVAAWLGASFLIESVGYNPVLQARVRALLAGQLKGYYHLEYGISVGHEDHPPAEVEAFHRLGAEQVRNLPPEVETLYMPAGSCNSCVSVLYGLARFLYTRRSQRHRLQRVVLFGIGPTRLEWIHRRLGVIEEESGVDILGRFSRRYHQHSALADEQNVRGGPNWVPALFTLEHHDLHALRFADYQDEMPYTLGGIEFHPTYEGKVLTYMMANRGLFEDFWDGSGRAAFWIVGSKPRAVHMLSTLRRFSRPYALPVAAL